MVAVCVVVAQGSPLFFLVSCGRASASAVFPLGVQACMAGVVVVKGVVSCALLTCGQVLAWWHAADTFIGPQPGCV